ncbi:MAG: hypothetical protein U1D55_11215 [Phycisphaerae bacterium]
MITDDPLQTILGRLQQVRRTGSGYGARCPAHEDQHASLSISRGNDGRVLLHCHAGCSPESVCSAIGLKITDLFAPRNNGHAKGGVVATFDYRDASGALLFQVVRFDPKEFRQRRPDGNGGWVWKLGRTPRVLYRLPELIAAPADAWVHVAEGEKDVENLVKRGVIATTCPQGAGKWGKLSDDSALDGRRVAIIADKDDAGRAHAQDVARRLHGRVADLRVLELPGVGKDASDWLASGGTVEQLRELVEAAPRYSPAAEPAEAAQTVERGDRPRVFIDTNEHRVVCETVSALNADPDIYQRGNMLVRVIRSTHPRDGIIRAKGAAMITALPAANLRERMTRYAAFTKLDRQGEEVPAHPPVWLVSAVDARGDWPGIRHLLGVSDAPVLRADGSIKQTPGYDPATGVLYEPATVFPEIPDGINIDDAHAAMTALLDVVCDFRFESEEHKAAWLAGLLTPLARFAFEGPTPLFLIDANVRGAGKGLLAQTIGWIVLGREMPVSSYAHDSDEMRKKITAIAIAGDRMLLFDNLEGMFGNDALDRALTSTRWKDRILGKSQEIELPLIPAWYATGNNVQVAADTTRRIIHVRLDVLDEHPEDRTGFKHPNLLPWIAEYRGVLLTRAITILAAYCRAGRPSQNLTPFGSFERWSAIVREAVVWVGLPDPCLTRTRLVEAADTTTDALVQFIAAWEQYDAYAQGFVISDMVNTLYPPLRENAPRDDASNAMRAAVENLIGCPPGKTPTARQLGNRLRRFRRRVIGGKYLGTDEARGGRGMVWRLHAAGGKR